MDDVYSVEETSQQNRDIFIQILAKRRMKGKLDHYISTSQGFYFATGSNMPSNRIKPRGLVIVSGRSVGEVKHLSFGSFYSTTFMGPKGRFTHMTERREKIMILRFLMVTVSGPKIMTKRNPHQKLKVSVISQSMRDFKK